MKIIDYFLFSELLNAVTSSLTFLLIIFNNVKTKTNQYFAFYTLCVAFWGIFQFLSLSSNNKDEALFYMRMCLSFAVFIPASFFHFSTHLTETYDQYSKIIKIFYSISFLTLLFAFSPFFIQDEELKLYGYYWPQGGPLFFFYFLQYLIYIVLSLFLIFRKYKESQNSKRQQLKLILWGILIAFIGGLTNFPLCFDIPIPPFGNILIPFYCVFIYYAIYKYQLMDISIVIKKSILYTALITIISIFYLILIYFAEHIVQAYFGYKSLFISICSATVIALAFTPLKNFIQDFIEKTFFRGSYTHISEENELLRQEILQTERLKAVSTLASGMAHEIKNPLTVIKTFSEFLPQKMDDKEFLKKFTPMIAQEVDRINNLVHEILDFAKPTLPVLKETNVHNLIQNTLDLLSNQYIKHNIKINTDFRLDPNTSLLLDSNQIKQALLNILLNAIDAMPHGGQLNISTYYSLKGEKINIKIQDSGIGIDKEDIEHIFDPFFSKKDSGTGLGLAITHEIIKKHDGKIFVESIKGKGAAFILEFNLFKLK